MILPVHLISNFAPSHARFFGLCRIAPQGKGDDEDGEKSERSKSYDGEEETVGKGTVGRIPAATTGDRGGVCGSSADGRQRELFCIHILTRGRDK